MKILKLHIIFIGLIFFSFLSCKKKETPSITTNQVISITKNSAIAGGKISTDGNSPILERGLCWCFNDNPSVNDNKVIINIYDNNFSYTLTNLIPNTIYNIRAFAKNKKGISYGNVITFKTKHDIVSDIDGNIYNIVSIGSQIWMEENLKTMHYQNGDIILNIIDNAQWSATTTGAYGINNIDYGFLYNWYAVNDNRNIAPAGWHVATDNDWFILSNYFGGDSLSATNLKEEGISHWNSPNIGANNNSGFTALPEGIRSTDGTYNGLGSKGNWWCSSEYDYSNAFSRTIFNDNISLFKNYINKNFGLSVRCVKN